MSCLVEQELRTRGKRLEAQGDEEEHAARLEKEANAVRVIDLAPHYLLFHVLLTCRTAFQHARCVARGGILDA